jgi:hypothetical protein
MKFGHLGKTKDLAATSTERKDGKIALLKANRNSGPSRLARPEGRSDRSFSTQIQFFWPIRLAGGQAGHRQDHASPWLCRPVGMTNVRPWMSIENMFCTGHHFQSCRNRQNRRGLDRFAENSCFVSGHGFSRAVND